MHKNTQPPNKNMNRGHGPLIVGGEKAKSFLPTMKRLAGYLKAAKYAILFVLVVTIIATIFSTYGPKLSGKATTSIQDTIMGRMAYDSITQMFDGSIPEGMTTQQIYEMMPNEQKLDMSDNVKNALLNLDLSADRPTVDFSYIGSIVVFCLGIYAFSAIFSFVQAFIMAHVTQKTVYRMRNDVKQKLAVLPMSYYDKYTHGEILSRVTNDIDNISNTMQQSLTQIITSAVQIIAVLAMMISISVTLTLITVCTLPVVIIITMFVAKFSQKEFSSNQKELGNLNGHVEEMYTGHKIVAAYGHEEKSISEFDDINNRLFKTGWRSQFISGIIMPLTNFVNNIGFLLICVVGGILTTKATLDLGGVIAFTQYSRQFTQPIVQISNIINILQSTAASAERVFEILDEQEEPVDKPNSPALKSPLGAVNFSHVKFGYTEDKILISDLNLRVKPGQTVAIVGPTGAGKTTLINLLMRFYEINSGKITIDDTNITDVTRSSLRDTFGMVLQDTWLFNGTINDNIAYGKEDATESDIIKAAKAAHVDHFVRTLSDGYNTVINEEASNISQGQKQLLTIARAVLADPAILILDEATSSVDTRTEVLIQKAMHELMVGRTSFVIAHRLSTIKNADLILVMKNGDIIEQGTHKSLLSDGGFYAELWNSQFANKSPDVAITN